MIYKLFVLCHNQSFPRQSTRRARRTKASLTSGEINFPDSKFCVRREVRPVFALFQLLEATTGAGTAFVSSIGHRCPSRQPIWLFTRILPPFRGYVRSHQSCSINWAEERRESGPFVCFMRRSATRAFNTNVRRWRESKSQCSRFVWRNKQYRKKLEKWENVSVFHETNNDNLSASTRWWKKVEKHEKKTLRPHTGSFRSLMSG